MRRDFVTVDAGRRSRQRSDEHHPGCRQDDSGSMSQPGGRLKTRLSRLSRRLSSVLLAGTLVLSGTVAQASPRIELEFPTWQAEEPGAAQFWKEAKTAFEQTHPDVWINLYQVPFKDFTDKMTLRFASDNPPQIVQLPTRNVQQFAAQNWLAALDDFLARSDIPATYTRLGDDMQWNGKTIGVPLMEYGMVLFYNERLLKQAGVTYPTTEAQLLKAISATTDPARGTFGWGATTMQHPNIYTDWASWATAEGASLYKKGDYNFTDPKVVQAIDHLRIALRHAPSGVSTESARQLFLVDRATIEKSAARESPLHEDGHDAVHDCAWRHQQQYSHTGSDRRPATRTGVAIHPDAEYAGMAGALRAGNWVAAAAPQCADARANREPSRPRNLARIA